MTGDAIALSPWGQHMAIPHSVEAEQQLLGALMYNNDTIPNVVDRLESDDFHSSVHARIYAVIVELWRDGRLANPVTLARPLSMDTALDDLGGTSYLIDLCSRSVIGPRVAEYADIIADLAARRRLQHIAADILMRACSCEIEDTADRQMEMASVRLRDAMADLPAAEDARTMAQAAAMLEQAQADILNHRVPPAIMSGLDPLDRLTGGFKPGQLIVVGARPGMGKTAFLLHLASAAARAGFGVSLASLEMTSVELMERMVAMHASRPHSHLHYERIASAELHPLNEARVAAAFDVARTLPIIINDRAPMTVQRIESGARTAHNILSRRSDVSLGLVLVDYMQLVKPGRRRKDMYEEMTEISNDLKQMAKRLGVPVVVASQLNRELEKRGDKRPMMADLRQTGAVEQDADKIIFPYRPARYDDEASTIHCEMIVSKNRQGRTGTAHINYEPGSNLFWDQDGCPTL